MFFWNRIVESLVHLFKIIAIQYRNQSHIERFEFQKFWEILRTDNVIQVFCRILWFLVYQLAFIWLFMLHIQSGCTILNAQPLKPIIAILQHTMLLQKTSKNIKRIIYNVKTGFICRFNFVFWRWVFRLTQKRHWCRTYTDLHEWFGMQIFNYSMHIFKTN